MAFLFKSPVSISFLMLSVVRTIQNERTKVRESSHSRTMDPKQSVSWCQRVKYIGEILQKKHFWCWMEAAHSEKWGEKHGPLPQSRRIWATEDVRGREYFIGYGFITQGNTPNPLLFMIPRRHQKSILLAAGCSIPSSWSGRHYDWRVYCRSMEGFIVPGNNTGQSVNLFPAIKSWPMSSG